MGSDSYDGDTVMTNTTPVGDTDADSDDCAGFAFDDCDGFAPSLLLLDRLQNGI